MLLFFHLFLLATPRMYKMYQVNDRASFQRIFFLKKKTNDFPTIAFLEKQTRIIDNLFFRYWGSVVPNLPRGSKDYAWKHPRASRNPSDLKTHDGDIPSGRRQNEIIPLDLHAQKLA